MLRNLLFFSLLSLSGAASFAAVDLHMHLTIDVPLSPFYSGSLNETVRAKDWDSRFKSKLDYDTLEKSDLKLIVAVIYINPIWGDIEKQFDAQMAEIQKFCELHPQWKIVKEPREAQEEIAKGNKVFVISSEGGWFFKEKELFDKLMQKYNVRILTPLHFSDLGRRIGKAAKQKGLFSPIQAILDFFSSNKYEGLTPMGEDLIQYLLDKKIWIDLSHSSQPVIDQFLKIRPKGYPILMTHTVMKKYYGTERGIDESLLKIIGEENGAVGLLPSAEMLTGTPTKDTNCEEDNPYLVQWKEVVAIAGAKNVFLGSDLNSPIKGLPPAKSGCPVFAEGLTTAADLKTLATVQDKDAVGNFLKEWELVRPSQN
ncbi:MAG: membrane dipeptidase [Bdellovibrionales bacterium]|nr:membrane dipeptidase [Bdellovibrionales bacterium]